MLANITAQQLLNIICNVFDSYSAVLFMPHGKREQYHLAAHFSLGDGIHQDVIIAPGQGLAGWIIRNREPLLINNFDQKRGVLGYYESGEEANIRAFMGCPLERGLGALCLDSKRTYSFSPKDQKILSQFAQLIGNLSQHACVMEAENAQHRYYSALKIINELRAKFQKWDDFLDNYLTIVAQASGFTHCLLAARDEKGENYFVEGCNQPLPKASAEALFPIHAGAVGWVFRNHAPLVMGDREGSSSSGPLFGKGSGFPAFPSAICLPLVANRITRCVMVLADENANGVTDEMLHFAHIVVDNLALFLENLYLKNRLTSRGGAE
jgi:GAF domain-containing protein